MAAFVTRSRRLPLETYEKDLHGVEINQNGRLWTGAKSSLRMNQR